MIESKEETKVIEDDEIANIIVSKEDTIVESAEQKDQNVDTIEDDVLLKTEKSSKESDNSIDKTKDEMFDNVEKSLEERYSAETDDIVDDEMNASLLNNSAARSSF